MAFFRYNPFLSAYLFIFLFCLDYFEKVLLVEQRKACVHPCTVQWKLLQGLGM